MVINKETKKLFDEFVTVSETEFNIGILDKMYLNTREDMKK